VPERLWWAAGAASLRRGGRSTKGRPNEVTRARRWGTLAGAVTDEAALLVLAGGQSRRMGRDKAWLLVDGQPALSRVLAAGRDAGLGVSVVVGSRGQPLPPLPPGVIRVDDPAERAHEGPLSGLAVGLEQLAARGVTLACLAACDALWLGPAHVRFVLGRLRAAPEHDAVVPEEVAPDGARVLHPLCAAVRVAPASRVARALVEAGQRAARALLLELRALRLPVASLPEPRVALACNTPEEWAAAVAALRGRTG
jgi:molybdopterin-guanine dinucleotide biosynthesis protein A